MQQWYPFSKKKSFFNLQFSGDDYLILSRSKKMWNNRYLHVFPSYSVMISPDSPFKGGNSSFFQLNQISAQFFPSQLYQGKWSSLGFESAVTFSNTPIEAIFEYLYIDIFLFTTEYFHIFPHVHVPYKWRNIGKWSIDMVHMWELATSNPTSVTPDSEERLLSNLGKTSLIWYAKPPGKPLSSCIYID